MRRWRITNMSACSTMKVSEDFPTIVDSLGEVTYFTTPFAISRQSAAYFVSLSAIDVIKCKPSNDNRSPSSLVSVWPLAIDHLPLTGLQITKSTFRAFRKWYNHRRLWSCRLFHTVIQIWVSWNRMALFHSDKLKTSSRYAVTSDVFIQWLSKLWTIRCLITNWR